jgi:uncharacterized protein
MYTNCRLLLFTRYPEAGKTKTRLIPELGAEGAALLQKRMTERVVAQANLLGRRAGIKTVVHYDGGSREKMTSWLESVDCVEQVDGELGLKMRSAFEHTFCGETDTAVLIGSDIPDITADLLKQAFASLLTKDVVIGPSQDGGYYLIGLVANHASELFPLLFEEMPWSTRELFSTTVNRIEKAGYDVAILPILKDIDLPADLSFAKEKGLL